MFQFHTFAFYNPPVPPLFSMVPVQLRSPYYCGTAIPQILRYCFTVLPKFTANKDLCAKTSVIPAKVFVWKPVYWLCKTTIWLTGSVNWKSSNLNVEDLLVQLAYWRAALALLCHHISLNVPASVISHWLFFPNHASVVPIRTICVRCALSNESVTKDALEVTDPSVYTLSAGLLQCCTSRNRWCCNKTAAVI